MKSVRIVSLILNAAFIVVISMGFQSCDGSSRYTNIHDGSEKKPESAMPNSQDADTNLIGLQKLINNSYYSGNDSILGIWQSNSILNSCNLSLNLYLEHDSLKFILNTISRSLKGSAILQYNHNMTDILIPLEWDQYKGDLTSITTKRIEQPKPQIASFIFDAKEMSLSLQNSGNAMDYYVIFDECDTKYISLSKK